MRIMLAPRITAGFGLIDTVHKTLDTGIDVGVIAPDSVDPNLGILGRIIKQAVEGAKENAQEHARSMTYEVIMGILEGLRDFVVHMSYSVALIGAGGAVILNAAGWRDGARWAGILTTAYVFIKYILG